MRVRVKGEGRIRRLGAQLLRPENSAYTSKFVLLYHASSTPQPCRNMCTAHPVRPSHWLGLPPPAPPGFEVEDEHEAQQREIDGAAEQDENELLEQYVMEDKADN